MTITAFRKRLRVRYYSPIKRLTAPALLLLCPLYGSAANSFDGQWWHSASKDERRGFLAGYIDCAAYDVGWKYLLDLSWDAVEPKVTEYYDAHASEVQTPVASVFAKLASSQQPRKAAGGETYPQEHGIFNGDYWRQAPAPHRLGYIEGYLVCQRAQGKPVATFSNTAGWYVAQISQWYGVRDDDPGEIDEKRADRKIANALYLLRDNATGSGTPRKKP